MRTRHQIVVLAALLPWSLVSAKDTNAPFTRPAYPLKVSSTNSRLLVDQTNTPILLVGDSPQSLFVNLTPAQANMYFADRAAHGINILWIMVLCNTYTGGRSDGSTYDGIVPFTTPGNMSTPNEAYFQRVDQMVKLAGIWGITVLLNTFDTGGWLAVLENNGPTTAFNYGVYLGNRYKNFKNIVWMTGNDFETWSSSTADNTDVAAIMAGIASVDQNHLQTTELNDPVSGSLDDTVLAPLTNLAGAYTYYPTYAEILNEYNSTVATRPVFLEEANYEFENNVGTGPGTPEVLRKQEYWTILSGAAGQLYGNHYTWTFAEGWQTYLDTPGVTQLGYMARLFRRYHWWRLVPDQAHMVVISGYGTPTNTGTIDSSDYVTAAAAADGSLVMAYCPVTTTVTVDMTKLHGLTMARWFDPSNGQFGKPLFLRNTATQSFSTPGANSSGSLDWLLILESW